MNSRSFFFTALSLLTCLAMMVGVGSTQAEIKITPDDGSDWDEFGSAVSIDGDYAIVAAPRDDQNGNSSGSAYIFHREGDGWTQQTKLLLEDPEVGDYFGWSASISGDYAIVGAMFDDDIGENSGSACIFHRSGDNWTLQAKLLADDGDVGDAFGVSVAIYNDYVIIGTWGDDAGSAYIFHRAGATWTQQAKLTADDGDLGDDLGCSVSIDGDYAVIGAYSDDEGGYNRGSAYIFHRIGASWTQQAKLIADDGETGDMFGSDVSINGDYCVIGAIGSDLIGSHSEPSLISSLGLRLLTSHNPPQPAWMI